MCRSIMYLTSHPNVIQETLYHRTQILEDAQNASKVAINKRRTVERLKGSSKMDPAKVDDALEEMREVSFLGNADLMINDKLIA